MDSRAIIIAYECSPKKERQFFRELCSVLDHGSRTHLIPLSSLPPGSHFDAILHKRTDDMVAALSGDEDAAARVRALENRLSDPNILAIDSLPGVRALLDRRTMAVAIDSVIRSAPPALQNRVRRLAWTTVHASSPNLLGHIQQAGLDYPVIVKRMLACGSRANHEMVIAYDDTGLLAAANGVFRGARLFVQEYVTSHGGALYKVYAIGRNIIVQTRAGLPATAKGDHPTTGYYYFDSQSLTTKTPKKPPSNSKAQAPEEIVSREIVRVLAEKLGLSLLGVDLLHDGATGKHVVVDVNYFPGYKGVKHAHKWLLEHLEELVEGHHLRKGTITAVRTQHLRKVAEKEACTSRAALEASKVLPGTNV